MKKMPCEKVYILAKDVNTEKFEIKAKKNAGLKRPIFGCILIQI